MIVIMAGLPGAGKSALAVRLAERLDGTVISKDTIRHSLFEPRDVEYSAEQDDFCMEVMLQTAEFILRRKPERIVFLDGRTFSRHYQLQRVISEATRIGQPWKILECKCSDQTARSRLQKQDDKSTHPAANRDYELYQRVKTRFEQITLPKVVIDTDRPLHESVEEALSAITSGS